MRIKTVVAALTLCLTLCLSGGAAPADETTENAKARLEAAQKVYEGILAKRQVDPAEKTDFERLYLWSHRWMEAQAEVGGPDGTKVKSAEAHLERVKKLEALVKGLVEHGHISKFEVAAAEFRRLEAERVLEEAKKK